VAHSFVVMLVDAVYAEGLRPRIATRPESAPCKEAIYEMDFV